MNPHTIERRKTIVFRFAVGTVAASLLIVLFFVALQAYVRWVINKDFLFLGGFELEALTFAAFALLFGLAYLYRPERN